MADWRKRVDINQFLTDDEMTFGEQGERVLAMLKAVPEFSGEDDGMLLEEMGDAVAALKEDGDANAREWFNSTLSAVYDVADRERIWLGV